MALTFTPDPLYPNDVWGSIEVRKVKGTPAASDYVLGGYTIAPGAGISLAQIYNIIIISSPPSYTALINPSTGKLQLYMTNATSGPLLEAAAGTNFAATPFVLLLMGK